VVEAGDAIGNGVARRDDQHRDLDARAPQALQDLEAVLAREPEVQHREIVWAPRRGLRLEVHRPPRGRS
jgi:hypothetical protein